VNDNPRPVRVHAPGPGRNDLPSQDLRKFGLKATAPRLKILGLLQESKDRHMSAEDIYRRLIASGEEIGLATVYRVLAQFEEAGMLTRHNFESGHSVFELDSGPHHDHMVCLETGEVIEFFDESIERRQQELAAAINNLQLLREGAARNSRQVANIVTATVEGMVLDVPVKEGSSVIERNNFNEGTTIATLADMGNLIFEGQVDESDVGKLKEGMPLKLTVGAISDYSFDALLEFISPIGEDVEGTVKFEVRAAVQPTDSVFLRAGYSANGDIILDRRKAVLAIKERDLIYQNDSTYVQLLVGERAFEKYPVKTGLSDGIMVEIVEGLDTTQQVKVLKGEVEE